MDPIAVLAISGLGLAALALFNGVVSMAHGGEADQRTSHLIMLQRTGWQAAAVAVVLLALLGYMH